VSISYPGRDPSAPGHGSAGPATDSVGSRGDGLRISHGRDTAGPELASLTPHLARPYPRPVGVAPPYDGVPSRRSRRTCPPSTSSSWMWSRSSFSTAISV